MANNRMYLVNQRTGDRIYLAKFFPSTGWRPVLDESQLAAAFYRADFGYLSEEEQAANRKHAGLCVPHPAAGGMYGEDWVLEYGEDWVEYGAQAKSGQSADGVRD